MEGWKIHLRSPLYLITLFFLTDGGKRFENLLVCFSICLQSCRCSKHSTPATTSGARTPPWFSWNCWKSTMVPAPVTLWDCCTTDRRELSRTAAAPRARWLSSVNTSRKLFHRTLKQIASWPTRRSWMGPTQHVPEELESCFKLIVHKLRMSRVMFHRSPSFLRPRICNLVRQKNSYG